MSEGTTALLVATRLPALASGTTAGSGLQRAERDVSDRNRCLQGPVLDLSASTDGWGPGCFCPHPNRSNTRGWFLMWSTKDWLTSTVICKHTHTQRGSPRRDSAKGQPLTFWTCWKESWSPAVVSRGSVEKTSSRRWRKLQEVSVL